MTSFLTASIRKVTDTDANNRWEGGMNNSCMGGGITPESGDEVKDIRYDEKIFEDGFFKMHKVSI